MSRVRVHNLSISVDGYAAGPGQDLANPLGRGGDRLHRWFFDADAGSPDARLASEREEGVGATIMGRNMFGPVRGAWPDDSWTGWWGEDPPYGHPVFVLTHHARPPVPMEGGTTFHFVTEGIHVALERAIEAAQGADVCIAGGAATVQQYLRAGLVDELHLAVAPVLLGSGERLFDRLDGSLQGYEVREVLGSAGATHVRIARTTARLRPLRRRPPHAPALVAWSTEAGRRVSDAVSSPEAEGGTSW